MPSLFSSWERNGDYTDMVDGIAVRRSDCRLVYGLSISRRPHADQPSRFGRQSAISKSGLQSQSAICNLQSEMSAFTDSSLGPAAAAIRHVGQLHLNVVRIGQEDLLRLAAGPHPRGHAAVLQR